MKKITAIIAAATLAASVSTAFAGGPVIIVEEPQPVVAAEPAGSGLGVWLPLLGAAAIVALIATN